MKSNLKNIFVFVQIIISIPINSQSVNNKNLKLEREKFQEERKLLEEEKLKLKKEREEIEELKKKYSPPEELEHDKKISKIPVEPIGVEEEKFFKLEETIVVTAGRKEQKILEAPSAVYVITEKQIRERGYRWLSDALHDIPGFDLIHLYGNEPEFVHQRGLLGNSQRTFLYVDGIPDNNIPANNIMQGSLRFPLKNVERIEIVSGPASSLYGTNAFNGIINIITKNGKDSPGHHVDAFGGWWESGFKNPGQGFSFSARGNSGLAKGDIQYSVGGYYFKTVGPYFGDTTRLDKKNYDPNNLMDYTEQKLCGGVCNPNSNSVGYYWSPTYNNAGIDTYNLTARFSKGGFRFQTINWQYLGGKGNFKNGTHSIDTTQRGFETKELDSRNLARYYGWANGVVRPDGFVGGSWNMRQNSVMSGYLKEFSPTLNLDSELVVRHSETYTSSQEQVPRTPGPSAYYRPGDVTTDSNRDRQEYFYKLDEKIKYEPNSKMATIAGVETHYTDVSRGYGSPKRFHYSNFATYLQQIYKPMSLLSITLGYRYDFNNIFGKVHTPRISAVIHPSSNLTIKLLFGTGFRAPTSWEMLNQTSSRKENLELRPETLRSSEINFGYRFLTNHYITTSLFHNRIKDIMLEVETTERRTSNPSLFMNQHQNIGNANIYGAEIGYNAEFSNILKLFLSYTFNKGEYTELSNILTSSPTTQGRKYDFLLLDIYNAISPRKTTPSSGPIPNLPTHKISAGITYYFGKDFSSFIGINWVDIRRTIATNPVKSVPGYAMFKLNFRWENAFIPGVYIQFQIYNATNQQFFDPGHRNATGETYSTMLPLEKRNIWLTVGYNFD